MRRSPRSGFALPELMMIVVLIGILSTTATISTQRARFERQRAALNSAVRDLAVWIDLVRARAANGTACTVSFASSSALAGGAALATVTPAACGSSLTLDAEIASLAAPIAVASDPASSTVRFTTSGGAQPSATATVAGFAATEVRVSSTSANLRRCLAISNGTGSLRLGAAGTSAGTCSYTAPL